MAERGSHERAQIEAILDEGFVCHVGFASDEGTVVLPMAYGRDGDRLYLHGAPANHLLRSLGSEAPACVTVTLVDGLVLARSQFHHSINYRSVVLFGRCRLVEDPSEATSALATVVDHVVPGRTADARPPSDKERRATKVLCFIIEEGSAKVRTGGPKEEPEDLALPIWGGVIPLETAPQAPVPDEPDGSATAPAPPYATSYRRPEER